MGANPSSFYPIWEQRRKTQKFDLKDSPINNLTKEELCQLPTTKVAGL
jgi:hypothetical protein